MDKTVSNYELQTVAARELFLSFDQERMIKEFRLPAEDGFLYIRFLGAEYRIHRASGRVDRRTPEGWTGKPGFEEVMSIYDMLCNSNGYPALSGKWLTVQDMNRLRSGAKTLGMGLNGQMEAFFAGRQEALHRACQALGGEEAPVGDVAYFIPIFDGFPAYFQFWDGDEDFPPQIRVLWDENTTRYIHFETTFYITAHLLDLLRDFVAKEARS